MKILHYPYSVTEMVRKRHQLRRELLEQSNLLPTRIAILGGSTTSEVKWMLELFLLANGIRPTFYESAYNRFFEEVQFRNQPLWDFKPNVVLIHTTWHSISAFPQLLESYTEVENRVRREVARFQSLWHQIHSELGAVVIQNNFDLPYLRPLGNLEASQPFGRINFVLQLNAEFAKFAWSNPWYLINDIHSISAQIGQAEWFRPSYWYSFHTAVSPAGTVALAHNVAAIIRSIYGRSKKCLVLDLDNTLWGGVIGDDGVDKILLGKDTAVGEAFLDFQKYVKILQQRGIILAVCSKNDPESAMVGFSHPDTVLKLEDFSALRVNWNPKPNNICEIAAELNIGLDSIVFVDDNPGERDFVTRQLPEVSVPDVGADVSGFAEVLERERFFEVDRLVQDDISRATFYSSNTQRSLSQATFSDYGEFLASLEMTAEIGPFVPMYLERIAQLVNKTNQFNLTTKRYTFEEIETIATDPSFVTLYGRLFDKFGDNGLVSVVVGAISGTGLEIGVWLMSCRVLKREMELAMFDALVQQCQSHGITEILGVYIPSKKNGLVSDHYPALGFRRVDGSPGDKQIWSYTIPGDYLPKARFIRRTEAGSLTTDSRDTEPATSAL